MVDLVPVRDADAMEIRKEFPGVFLFPPRMEVVQGERMFLQCPGTLDPHVALASCGASVAVDHDWRLVRMDYMVAGQLSLHAVVYLL